jgi:inner membrane protein
MLTRTHLVISIFFILLFISYVENKFVFVFVVLFATLLVDIDSKYSRLGRKKIFRPLQFFIRHRTVFHSFIFLILITLFFVWVFPVLAFPFFLGYSVHLFADSFTVKGIKPFYPWKKLIYGKLRTGSRMEMVIFVCFLILDILLILLLVNRGF